MLVAGNDTTGTTMSWLLYELALNQDCQDTLYEEIESAKTSIGLTYDTIQSLPYLEAVIHETLRRHPVVPTLERPCIKDYKVPGHDLVIPKGGIVRLNNIGICYDPEIFPEPKRFNPERFLKENRGDRNPYSFMGFSLGPRNCLAMRFAMFEMKMCISHLVANFRFLPCEKTIKDLEYDPTNFLGGTKGGLWIQCEHR
jgi:cytochrome P450 family 6